MRNSFGRDFVMNARCLYWIEQVIRQASSMRQACARC